MGGRLRRAAASLCLLALALGCSPGRRRETPPPPAPPAAGRRAGAAAPDETPGAAIFRNDCLACHSADLVEQQRLTEAQWRKVVEKMQRWGAPTEPENVLPLTAWLVSNYGTGARPYVPESLASKRAAADLGPREDVRFAAGDRDRGKALYADRCAPCHGDDGRGGEGGVALAGRLVVQRAPDFASAVREGRGRMPSSEELTDAEIGHLLAYLRSMRP